MLNTIPATAINDYSINVDLYKLMVKQRVEDREPLLLGEYADVNLFTVNYQTAQTRYISDCFILEKAISDDNSYHLRFNILYNNEMLGFIYTDRTKKYGFNLDKRPLHIDNKAFYTLNVSELLPRFLNAFGLSVSNHTQLDIAIDTQETDVAELIQFYTMQPSNYQRIKRRGDTGFKRIGELDEITGITTYSTTFSNARVAVKMYNKTTELVRKPKHYLSQFHTEHGFSSDKSVYRVEITIKAKALKKSERHIITEYGEELTEHKYNTAIINHNEDINGHIIKESDLYNTEIDITKLNSKGYLASLFAKFFPITIRTANSIKLTRCKEIQLINFNKYTMEDINTTKTTKETDNKFIKEKRSIKDNLATFRKTGNPLFFEAAATLSSLHQLQGYLNEVVRIQRLEDYIKRCGLQSMLEDIAIENYVYTTY